MDTYRGRASPMGEVTGAVHDAMWRDGESACGTPAFGSHVNLRSINSQARGGANQLVRGEEGARHHVYMQESGSPRRKMDEVQSRKLAADDYASAAALVSAKYSRDQQMSGRAKQARRFLGGEISAAAGGGVADSSSASGPAPSTAVPKKGQSAEEHLEGALEEGVGKKKKTWPTVNPPLVRGRLESPRSSPRGTNDNNVKMDSATSSPRAENGRGNERTPRSSSTKRRSPSRSSSTQKKNSDSVE